MKYISICSGIEAATMAFHHLGWEPLAFSEIEPFPSAVLAHHYPDTPNFGDMTQYMEWPEDILAECDMVVGGPPCQAFSVAGLRNSLNDDRGNLTLTYVHLINHIDSIRRIHGRNPVVALYENVPGILSTGDNAFGCLVGAICGQNAPVETETGKWPKTGVFWGEERRVGYRTLDAQYFGVAQRRRRIFLLAVPNQLVADTGDKACPSSILSIAESLRGNPAPSRQKGKETAGGVAACLRSGGDGGVPSSRGEHLVASFAYPINTMAAIGRENEKNTRQCLGIGNNGDPQFTLQSAHSHAVAFGIDEEQNPTVDFFGTLKAREKGGGFEGVVAFQQNTRDEVRLIGGDGSHVGIAPTLDWAQPCAVACFSAGQSSKAGSLGYQLEQSPTLRSGASGTNMTPTLHQGMQVRRLTPICCERLQGFPDNFTNIPWRNKPEAPDGPRYKSLGNSMAVPVMAWIGERLNNVFSAIPKKQL